jgi:hypothetical protein
MLNTKVGTTPYELCSLELCTIIRVDPSRHAEPEHCTLQKLDHYILRDVYHWHCFHTFCECINSYKEMCQCFLHRQDRGCLLAILKPNRIIRKRTDANCSSFHLRVFLGLWNPRDKGRLALYLYRVITLVKEKLRLI